MREGNSVLVTGGAGFLGSHLCEALVVPDHHRPGYDTRRVDPELLFDPLVFAE